MTISPLKIKFLGKTQTIYRVLDQAGEVLFIGETAKECKNWIDAEEALRQHKLNFYELTRGSK